MCSWGCGWEDNRGHRQYCSTTTLFVLYWSTQYAILSISPILLEQTQIRRMTLLANRLAPRLEAQRIHPWSHVLVTSSGEKNHQIRPNAYFCLIGIKESQAISVLAKTERRHDAFLLRKRKVNFRIQVVQIAFRQTQLRHKRWRYEDKDPKMSGRYVRVSGWRKIFRARYARILLRELRRRRNCLSGK
jgi:hypothetical protein